MTVEAVRGQRPRITLAIILLTGAAAALALRSFLEPSRRDGRTVLLEYAFVVFSAIALNYLTGQSFIRERIRSLLDVKWLIFIFAALLAVWSYRLGMYQFGGYDEGFLVNLAYHYLHGYKPITDYPSTMPPLFMAGIRTVVLVLPFRWASLVMFSSLFGAVTALWFYGLFIMLRVPSHWALSLTTAIELSTMFVLPFWWYNNCTSISVLLLVVSVVCCLQSPRNTLAWVSLAISLGMTTSAKPNVALVCLTPCVLLVSRDRAQWLRAAVAFLGAISVAWIIFSVAQMPPLALLRSYREVSGSRGNPLQMYAFQQFQPWEALILAFFAGFLLILYFDFFAKVAKRSLQSRQWRLLLAVSFLTALTAFEMVCTNGETKNVDLIVLYGALVLLLLRVPSEKPIEPDGRSVLLTLTIFFAIWSGFFGIIHLRILTIGEGLFYQPLPTQRIQSGFLVGLDAGPRLLEIQKQVSDVLAKHPGSKVFFGPRLEFEAAVFGKELIPGLPVQWEPGSQYPASRTPVLLENLKRQDPDLLIFLKRDFTRMYSVGDYIREAPIYRAVLNEYPDLEIYIRQRGQEAGRIQ